MENKRHVIERLFAASPTSDITVSEQIRQGIDDTACRGDVVLLCEQSSGAVVGFGGKVVVATRRAAKLQFQRDLFADPIGVLSGFQPNHNGSRQIWLLLRLNIDGGLQHQTETQNRNRAGG